MLLAVGLGVIIVVILVLMIEKLEERVKALEEKGNAARTPSPHDLSRQPTLRQFMERERR